MRTVRSDSPAYAAFYKKRLLDDVMPFWLKHAMDARHGGIMTALDRDGTIIDNDKSVWFQGRAGWMFATLYNKVQQKPEWIRASKSCVDFILKHCAAPDGKLYFTVTRDGRPLRMRRYVYSESFAAIACAALAKATGDAALARRAMRFHAVFADHCFTPGRMPAKVDPDVRPMQGLGPHMIGIAMAQELRDNLGDVKLGRRTCTEWIDWHVAQVHRFMLQEDHAVAEIISADGRLIDHFDGRTLVPGHAIEAAWFIMHEARLRENRKLLKLGTTILDWMWKRGWDSKFGGMLYFTDIRGLPVQEYWHDMKFWWVHCETIIACLLAWKLTGNPKYARWHKLAHDWSFRHFADRRYGEWYGYLHRDGTVSVPLKGNMWKGPFHLPRALLYCWKLLEP